jgi:hypothetical protein
MGSSPFGEQHEWAMRELCEMITKKGDRIGSRAINSITPRGADKIYDRLTLGPKGPRLRTAEKIVLLGRKAWRVVHRLYQRSSPSPRLVQTLLQKGWIEEQNQGPKNEILHRLTELGLEAKKLPIPIPQRRRPNSKGK